MNCWFFVDLVLCFKQNQIRHPGKHCAFIHANFALSFHSDFNNYVVVAHLNHINSKDKQVFGQ